MAQNFEEFTALSEECARLQKQVAMLNSEMTAILISISKLRRSMVEHVSGEALPLEEDQLGEIFKDGPMKYQQLYTMLKSRTNWGDNKVKEMIRFYIQSGKIIRDGRDRSPKTRYILPQNGRSSGFSTGISE